MKRSFLIALALAPLLALAWPTIPRNPSVTLAWDHNPIGDGVAGYILYSARQSWYSGTNPVAYPVPGYTNWNVGYTNAVTVSNLTVGVTYYFVVTAYTTNNLESLPSDEVKYTVQAQPNQPKKTRVTVEF